MFIVKNFEECIKLNFPINVEQSAICCLNLVNPIVVLKNKHFSTIWAWQCRRFSILNQKIVWHLVFWACCEDIHHWLTQIVQLEFPTMNPLIHLCFLLIIGIYQASYIPTANLKEPPYASWAHEHWIWIHRNGQNHSNLIDLYHGYTSRNIPVCILYESYEL